MDPLVSVILPIYKGEQYLKEAVDSILNQSYSNLELILINDCSPDNSVNVIKSYTDERISIINNKVNLGLIAALNIGLKNSKGKYIARMDQDDIAYPNRIYEQVRFMESNNDISVVSANYQTFGSETRTTNFAQSPEQIKLELHFHSCICHPLAMFRAKDVSENNLEYDKNFKDTEDWAMWFSVIKKGLKISNLPSVLLKYRLEGQSTTPQDKVIRKEQFLKMYKHILLSINPSLSNDQVSLHWSLSNGGVENIKRKDLNNYIYILTRNLIADGIDPEQLKTLLKIKKDRLICKFTDKSIFEGIKFMFNHNLFETKNFKYILAKLISKKNK
jgi:glycosyltransferase involved in cell wall biosynthesis